LLLPRLPLWIQLLHNTPRSNDTSVDCGYFHRYYYIIDAE